jgi:hypothetical protein
LSKKKNFKVLPLEAGHVFVKHYGKNHKYYKEDVERDLFLSEQM